MPASRAGLLECLDWVLVWNRRHLERVLSGYIDHYNRARPPSIGLEVPVAPDKLPVHENPSGGPKCFAA